MTAGNKEFSLAEESLPVDKKVIIDKLFCIIFIDTVYRKG